MDRFFCEEYKNGANEAIKSAIETMRNTTHGYHEEDCAGCIDMLYIRSGMYLKGVEAERSRPISKEQREVVISALRSFVVRDRYGDKISFREVADAVIKALGKDVEG